MPRHSVDIDLIYLPVADRHTSLEDINASLDRIARAIIGRNPGVKALRIAGGGSKDTRILVSDGQAQIKIETSPVTRGAVYPARPMVPSEAVTERFGFVEMNVLAFEDLYGGKLHAALDRQHPHDLFDVKLLYENEGLTDHLFWGVHGLCGEFRPTNARALGALDSAPRRPKWHRIFWDDEEGRTYRCARRDAPTFTRRHQITVEWQHS